MMCVVHSYCESKKVSCFQMPEHSLSNDPVLVCEVLQTKPIWVLQFSLNPCLPPQCVVGQEVYGMQ